MQDEISFTMTASIEFSLQCYEQGTALFSGMQQGQTERYKKQAILFYLIMFNKCHDWQKN